MGCPIFPIQILGPMGEQQRSARKRMSGAKRRNERKQRERAGETSEPPGGVPRVTSAV